jgi:hypothetical protein
MCCGASTGLRACFLVAGATLCAAPYVPCREYGVTGRSRMRKAELVVVLEAALGLADRRPPADW